jgi:putative ABC transport system permease protein
VARSPSFANRYKPFAHKLKFRIPGKTVVKEFDLIRPPANANQAPPPPLPTLPTKHAIASNRPVISLTQLLEAFRVAGGAIVANRLRSVLTVLGVVIGVTVVALVAALLEGAQRFVGQQADELGPNVVQIGKASFLDFVGDGQAFVEALAKRPDVTIAEVATLRERLKSQLDIGAQVDASLPVQRNNKSLKGIAVQGVTANAAALASLKIERGRELTDIDDEFRRPVCLIGADVADYLFTDANPVGATLKIGAASYEVVGVTAPRGSSFGASQDAFVQLPLGTFSKVFGTRSRSLMLLGRALPEVDLSRDQAEELLRFELRKLRRLGFNDADNFSVITAKSIEAFAGSITAIVAFVLYPLTGIALIVGGIVVMNMMLASVTERTREIGIRLALGARRRDILAQFLLESTLLTLAGGAIGVALAALVVWLAAKITGLPIALPFWALAASVLLSCLVGVVFGVVPARRASRLSPIEALRKE